MVQPHLMSSFFMASDAHSRGVQNGVHPSSVFFQPQSAGFTCSCKATKHWLQLGFKRVQNFVTGYPRSVTVFVTGYSHDFPKINHLYLLWQIFLIITQCCAVLLNVYYHTKVPSKRLFTYTKISFLNH